MDSNDVTETILITGGAGYIGSHTARLLVDSGFDVIVIDNLYSGHRWAIPAEATLVEGSAGDRVVIDRVFSENTVAAVIHFAGHIVVPESVADPLKYYRNNVLVSQELVDACQQHAVNRLIFSSSAAVYGEPGQSPIDEGLPTLPISPYGTTKLITEWMLRDVAVANDDFEYVALRYFNVAGAHASGELGQATPEATHLIKIACQAAVGSRDNISVFGQDYPTADGTCIRDYIHVEDLAHAHLDSLRYLLDGGDSVAMNCGYGHGYSVREVVNMVKQVSGVDFTVVDAPRRAGDPPELVAANDKVRSLTGWTPRFDDLELICRSALNWEQHGLKKKLST